MSQSLHYYQSARLRSGVAFLVGERKASFQYDTLSFDIDCNEAASHHINRLCTMLEQGLDFETIADEFDEFESHAWNIIDAFDRYGLLTSDAPPDPGATISGPVFWRQLDAFAHRCRMHFKPLMFQALLDGKITRAQLIQYVIQYYHVVRAGPGIIASSLAHEDHPATKQVLQSFLISEMGHENLMLSALESVGITSEAMQDDLPLPPTFALTSAFQVFSDQEPLTFKSVVFLLEEANPDFHDAFRLCCEKHGLPQAFWEPVISHADINDDGDHGSISEQLLEHTEVITIEQRTVVMKQLATTIETIIDLEKAILSSRQ